MAEVERKLGAADAAETTPVDMKEDSEVTKARHDIFIQEIEGMDDYWGSTFRTIYDKSEQEQFIHEVEERIREHDKNIERMCNFHYQGFIDSIRELLQVRTEANKLKNEVCAVNSELKDASGNMLRAGDALAKARRVQINIHEGVEALKACLPLLATYGKLKKQMEERRFHPALKTLEALEHTHLPAVHNYRFSQMIRDNIPRIRDSIKEASMSDLKDFLEEVRQESPRIGEVAMRHASERFHLDAPPPRHAQKRHTLAFLGVQPISPIDVYGETEPSLGEELDDDELSAHDLVNFSPVYRCLHIFSALGSRDTFEAYYRKQRQKQSRLALQPPANMHENFSTVRDYLHGIAGFFVVEDHVLNTTDGLVSRPYLDQLWSEALGQAVTDLQTHSAYCTEPNMLLTFKRLIMIFSHTMRNYSLAVQPLHDLLLQIRDHYSEVLMLRWVQVFRDIFDKDNYHPIQVDTQQEYDQITQVFPYTSEQLEKAPFPRRFPFSLMVPKVYSQVKEFIRSCLRFSDDLDLSQSEKDDMIRRSTNILLTRTLSGCLATLIRKPGLGLLQLIQITINTIYLEQASTYLEQVITNITGYNAAQDGGVHSRLLGRSMFKDIRAESEEQIYIELQAKIDEFLELASYDWTLAESDGTASSFLVDLLYFLQTTFLSFTNLPPKVAQTACMSSCQHVARSLLSLLLSDDVKQLSMGALQQLNLDVIQCEQFAASEPVSGFEEGALQMCFADLRQLLDLVLAWDWPAYFQQYGTPENQYGRVSPATAAALLEKFREADKRNLFSVLKRAERDKKKQLDSVLKQLKQLAVSTAREP